MKNNQDQAVVVENLHKVFYSVEGFWRQRRHPVVAVEDISFSIGKGELFGMVGPNGAGKTTTVKMLSTLLLPTAPRPATHRVHFRRQQRPVRSSQRVG